MALTSGQRVGPYEVVALVDGGGQGQVYRARDTRLSREVAVKVLSDAPFDERRRARFAREAQALAALNHPNIATLIGVEESHGVLALVMELVEGESLAARLAAAERHQLATTDALSLARQIADALEAAHERGLVHRDLKPANVMIRPDGGVKLVDFGLAKSFKDDGGGAAAETLTLTGADGVVGTVAYMSPEQARGTSVDRRTDVWGFGCVLYEMLTGRRPFEGATKSDTIVSVLTREPDFDGLPADVPRSVRRLLRRCLEKDVKNRLNDLGDARLEIADALAGRGDDAFPVDGPIRAGTTWTRYALAILGAATIGAMAAWLTARTSPADSPPVSRSSVVVPPSAPLRTSFWGRSIALSADGSRLVYTSAGGFAVRARDRLDVKLLDDLGTFAQGPFLSPDGSWVGYFDGADLKRVPIDGGSPTRIAGVGPGATGNWGPDAIVFADVWGLFRVSPDGGTPEKLATRLAEGEQAAFPVLLPRRRGILFTVLPTRTISVGHVGKVAASRIEVLDLRTGEQRTLLHGASHARYIATGHLLYTAAAALEVVAFDLEKLEVRGNPVPLNVAADSEFAVSEEGTLIYTSGNESIPNTLVWVDRQGREEPLEAPPLGYLYPRLSPDGRRVALDVVSREDRDIWIWDLQRRVLERFTVDPAGNPLAAWSPDGTRLAFGSDRFGATNLFWQAADGGGSPERILPSARIQMPLTFAPDGRLLFSEEVPGEGRNIQAVRLDSRRVEAVIRTTADELNAEISPDGRFVAYDSNESGRFEIYVRPYPDTLRGGRWQISTGGGRQPLWSRDGRELYYRDSSGTVMGVPVTLAPSFSSTGAVRLLDGTGYMGAGLHNTGRARTYDVASDGRFLMIKAGQRDAATGPSLVLVQNWFEELDRLSPAR